MRPDDLTESPPVRRQPVGGRARRIPEVQFLPILLPLDPRVITPRDAGMKHRLEMQEVRQLHRTLHFELRMARPIPKQSRAHHRRRVPRLVLNLPSFPGIRNPQPQIAIADKRLLPSLEIRSSAPLSNVNSSAYSVLSTSLSDLAIREFHPTPIRLNSDCTYEFAPILVDVKWFCLIRPFCPYGKHLDGYVTAGSESSV